MYTFDLNKNLLFLVLMLMKKNYLNKIWHYPSIVWCGCGANWFLPGFSSIKSCAPGFAARCFQRGCYFQENCALANGEGLNGVLRVMKTTLLVPHDCKKNHHRPKFCHCVFYSVLRRELSAYSMFWWGMAVKKLLSFSSLKFSYSYGCLFAWGSFINGIILNFWYPM